MTNVCIMFYILYFLVHENQEHLQTNLLEIL